MNSSQVATLPRDSTRTPSPGVGIQSSLSFSPVPGASMSSHSSPGSSSELPLSRLADPHNTFHHLQQSDSHGSFDSATQNDGFVVPVVSAASLSGGNTEKPRKTKPVANRRRQVVKSRSDSVGSEGGNGGPNRRVKRLERNRESARLSRRRRKQYLEHLEERVSELSEEMDRGRRERVGVAVSTVTEKRNQLILQSNPAPDASVAQLDTGLSRASRELSVVNTFQSQQLKSFCAPPSTKFILWLSLQSDTYFRGGRAASERLSAARIGERMLSSGTDKAAPTQSMWPLLCHEVGLSYDQEEKVRAFQRTLLQDHESWLHRHSDHAGTRVMDSLHDSIQALALRGGQRERSSATILGPAQRLKLLAWTAARKDKVKAMVENRARPFKGDEQPALSPTLHEAANLYIVNHRLQKVLQTVPRAAPLVTGVALKKLSRRPSFESLGAVSDRKENTEGGLSREDSFNSSGSLKRSSSEMAMEGEEKPQIPSISPEEAQAKAAPLVERVLGFLKDVIPPPPVPTVVAVGPTRLVLPAPTPVESMMKPFQGSAPSAAFAPPAAFSPATAFAPPAAAPQAAEAPTHVRKSSFLPAHLNVVPEEMWPADAADDFLMNLVDEDWAIGGGIDMDTEQ